MSADTSQPSHWFFDFTIELLLFLFQVLTFFIVAFVTSYMFTNEARLTAFVSARINAATMTDLGLTLIGATFCLGVVAIVKEMIPGRFVEQVSKELLSELPRTIYLFGSSITAAILAVAVFTAKNPSASHTPSRAFWWTSIFFASIFFIYGYGAKILLARRLKANSGADRGQQLAADRH